MSKILGPGSIYDADALVECPFCSELKPASRFKKHWQYCADLAKRREDDVRRERERLKAKMAEKVARMPPSHPLNTKEGAAMDGVEFDYNALYELQVGC